MSDNGHDSAWAFPVYPQLQWNDRDYAQLKGRLHLFDDHIVLEKFDKGQPTEVYLVDPLDLAGRLNTLGLTSGPLPRNCLFWSRQDGEDRLGIYIEPQVWPVSVAREKKIWHVPLPGLVFIGQGQKYGLMAVKGTAWPTADTKLYHAPVPNTWTQTGVCRGNAPFPVAASATMWTAVEVFFKSEFNNHLANGKSKKHPGNILDFWRELSKSGATTYPEDDLNPANLTLNEVLT